MHTHIGLLQHLCCCYCVVVDVVTVVDAEDNEAPDVDDEVMIKAYDETMVMMVNQMVVYCPNLMMMMMVL